MRFDTHYFILVSFPPNDIVLLQAFNLLKFSLNSHLYFFHLLPSKSPIVSIFGIISFLKKTWIKKIMKIDFEEVLRWTKIIDMLMRKCIL